MQFRSSDIFQVACPDKAGEAVTGRVRAWPLGPFGSLRIWDPFSRLRFLFWRPQRAAFFRVAPLHGEGIPEIYRNLGDGMAKICKDGPDGPGISHESVDRLGSMVKTSLRRIRIRIVRFVPLWHSHDGSVPTRVVRELSNASRHSTVVINLFWLPLLFRFFRTVTRNLWITGLAAVGTWQILTDLDRSWQILTGRHDWFLDGVLHPRARGVGGGRWSLGRWESHPPWGSESRFRCARCLFALGCCQWRRHDLLDTLKNTMDHEQKDREKTEVSLFL